MYLDRLSHDSPSEVLVLVSWRHLHAAWLSDYEEIFHLKEQPSLHHIPSFRIFAKAKNIVYFIQLFFLPLLPSHSLCYKEKKLLVSTEDSFHVGGRRHLAMKFLVGLFILPQNKMTSVYSFFHSEAYLQQM